MTNLLKPEMEPGDILCGCRDGFVHETHECPWETMRCETDELPCNCCVQCQLTCMGEPEEDTYEGEDYDEDEDYD